MCDAGSDVQALAVNSTRKRRWKQVDYDSTVSAGSAAVLAECGLGDLGVQLKSVQSINGADWHVGRVLSQFSAEPTDHAARS